jgi:hypothetical protein
VYSIPLDSARQDASPHVHAVAVGGGSNSDGSGGSAGGGSAGSGGPAGGAGSTAGGAGSAGGGAGGGGNAGSKATGTVPVLVPGGQPGSLVHSSNGFGSSSSVPGLNSTPSAGLGAVQSDASSAPTLAILLALVVLAIGAYAGTRARRAPRGTPPASTS